VGKEVEKRCVCEVEKEKGKEKNNERLGKKMCVCTYYYSKV
jgi:hypothetical protein